MLWRNLNYARMTLYGLGLAQILIYYSSCGGCGTSGGRGDFAGLSRLCAPGCEFSEERGWEPW